MWHNIILPRPPIHLRVMNKRVLESRNAVPLYDCAHDSLRPAGHDHLRRRAELQSDVHDFGGEHDLCELHDFGRHDALSYRRSGKCWNQADSTVWYGCGAKCADGHGGSYSNAGNEFDSALRRQYEANLASISTRNLRDVHNLVVMRSERSDTANC